MNLVTNKYWIIAISLICLSSFYILSCFQDNNFRLVKLLFISQTTYQSANFIIINESTWNQKNISRDQSESMLNQNESIWIRNESLYYENNTSMSNKRKQTKIILFWNKFFGVEQKLNGLDSCPELNCLLTNNRSFVNESSSVIFHIRDLLLYDLPTHRYHWQRYVYQLYESPQHTDLDLHEFSGYFNWTMTYRLDSDIPSLYGRFVKLNSTSSSETLNEKEILGFNKSLVAWMVSNCNTPSKRERYVEILRKYISIDVFGSCSFSTLKCPKNAFEQCNTMIGNNYRFYLAFENSICIDYVTEKFYSRAHLNIIPIVLKRSIVENILPKNSFIAADDFQHPKYLARYLHQLARNDQKYLSYFIWRTEDYIMDHQSAYCLMCKKLWSKSEPRKIYTNINSWWTDGTCDANFVTNQLLKSSK